MPFHAKIDLHATSLPKAIVLCSMVRRCFKLPMILDRINYKKVWDELKHTGNVKQLATA
jgi:hypothetical protein